MITLHIEHPITDYATWKAAFDSFAAARETAGVRAHAIHRPVAEAHYVLIDLDFDTEEAATAFLHFLRTRVWAEPAHSPALAGEPTTRLLVIEDRRSDLRS